MSQSMLHGVGDEVSSPSPWLPASSMAMSTQQMLFNSANYSCCVSIEAPKFLLIFYPSLEQMDRHGLLSRNRETQ